LNILEWTLHQAAQRGLFDSVKNLILSNKASANDKDDQNCTALHWAAINNHIEIAKFLLSKYLKRFIYYLIYLS